VVEAVSAGSARCWALDVKPKRLFDGNRMPGFKANLQLKDLGIVLETAHTYGVSLPGTAISSQLYQAMVDNGMGELDNSGVIAIIEMLAGEKLSVENIPGVRTAHIPATATVSETPPKKAAQAASPTIEAPSTTSSKVIPAIPALKEVPPSAAAIETPKIQSKESALPISQTKEVAPASPAKEVAQIPAAQGSQLKPSANAVSPVLQTNEASPIQPTEEVASIPPTILVPLTPKQKETPPFIEIPQNLASEKIRASRSKTTPLK